MLDAEPERPRLLIAEDDAALAETMRDGLGDDFSIDIAGDGDDAVSLARRGRHDIVVIDAQMPSMDGIDACRALRRDPRTVDLPIIMVTESAEPDQMSAAFDAGVTDYLSKPFSISQLRSRARTCLLRRRAS